jgi:hypothetical protein
MPEPTFQAGSVSDEQLVAYASGLERSRIALSHRAMLRKTRRARQVCHPQGRGAAFALWLRCQTVSGNALRFVFPVSPGPSLQGGENALKRRSRSFFVMKSPNRAAGIVSELRLIFGRGRQVWGLVPVSHNERRSGSASPRPHRRPARPNASQRGTATSGSRASATCWSRPRPDRPTASLFVRRPDRLSFFNDSALSYPPAISTGTHHK